MKLNNHIVGFVSGCLGAALFYFLAPAKVVEHTDNVKSGSDHFHFIEHAEGTQHFTSLKSNLDNDAFVEAASVSTKSVVFIKSKSANLRSNNWFDLYFNQGGSSVSSGSGVILKKNGYIVTNYHVIERSDEIQVIHGKSSYDAEVVGYDKSTDLAVLKIEADDLPAISIGSSRNSKIGEWVLAVGNPLNLQLTVTAGIISAKGRILNVVNSNFPIESFIQTDAAINPGNSGGALVNTKGQLIGINTAIVSETGSYAGYGFAVPVDIVVKVADDIIKYGDVQNAVFGAEILEINSELGEKLNITSLEGVVIDYVEEDGTADKAGLQQGDVIVDIDGQDINTHAEFNEQMAFYRPGDKIKLHFLRNGKEFTKDITLLNRDGGTGVLVRKTKFSESLGAELEVISQAEKRKLNVNNGVRVAKIGVGVMQRLGIKEGFIITSINGLEITTVDELEKILLNITGRVTIRGITEQGAKGYYSYWF